MIWHKVCKVLSKVLGIVSLMVLIQGLADKGLILIIGIMGVVFSVLFICIVQTQDYIIKNIYRNP